MISLKKFLESENAILCQPNTPVPFKTVQDSGIFLSAWQATLAAIRINSQRVVPAPGSTIDSALARISDELNHAATPEAVHGAERQVDEELTRWADKAQEGQQQSEQTIRELLVAVSEATESTGNRDEKFSREIVALSDRLRAIAGLNNLPTIRRSIIENASALDDTVTRMAEEGRESINRLTSEVAEYQTRLDASERRALIDPLTGLCNRRGFEQQLDMRVQSRRSFSLLVADLNGFKAMNDQHGHVLGDEILRQFATELKGQFLADDTVARWGGDEFVCIVAGPAQEGAARAERIRHWVLGEYKIPADTTTITVKVDAAVGTVAWNGAESGLELFARADKEMYRMKQGAAELV